MALTASQFWWFAVPRDPLPWATSSIRATRSRSPSVITSTPPKAFSHPSPLPEAPSVIRHHSPKPSVIRCHGPYPGALCHGPYPGALLLRGLCGSLFLRGLCGSLFLPQWLSPSGTNKSVASVVWLSRQRRNPAATDTYQSQAQTQSEGRVAVCQSERSAQLNFISPW
jgi:hypothetical protein